MPSKSTVMLLLLPDNHMQYGRDHHNRLSRVRGVCSRAGVDQRLPAASAALDHDCHPLRPAAK